MMTTSWFDGPLSKANINRRRVCERCGAQEEHCIVSDEGKKLPLCDACFKAHVADLKKGAENPHEKA